MAKQILVITYAVPEELEAEKVQNVIDEQKKYWLENRLTRLGRLKAKLNKRYYEKEVILVETGIGKVNSYKALKLVIDTAADHLGLDTEVTVLNLGTAASINAKIGDIVKCNRFIERDLIRVGYGSKEDYTIYLDKEDNPTYLGLFGDGPRPEDYDTRFSCNSGDSFVTDPEEAYQMRDGWTAVCDMEGFSQAQVLAGMRRWFSKRPKFHCVKYITDKIGEDNTLEGWKEELPAARMMLTEHAIKAVTEFYSSK